MEISLIPAGLDSWSGNVLIVGLIEGKTEEQLDAIDRRYDIQTKKVLTKLNFTPKLGKTSTFQLLEKSPEKLIFVGLGKQEDITLDDLRKAAASGARSSIGNIGSLGIIFPWEETGSDSVAGAIYEAVRLSLFKDVRFKSQVEPRLVPNKLELIGLSETRNTSISQVGPICAGVELAREMVSAPANSLTPSALAESAKDLANKYPLKALILEKEDCKKKGMGSYLAVCEGSDLAPKFIHLTYQPKGEIKRRLAIIGKGLTFDSGGYNLKVGAAQIELMKFDMGGSAAVIGAARAIGEICPQNTEVHFIVAACENMINGSAVHPGDIVTASNGKTIEINNTDAEGRLTLADALVYASKLKPDAIVDLATLTGACVIALGNEIAGLWTENNHLAEEIKNAAQEAGEGLWRMPFHNSYKEGLKSLLADLKNTGPRQGGSITAALFLKEFVDTSIPWAHIDIAGPVWTEKDTGINPAGATGYGVRTLVKWILK